MAERRFQTKRLKKTTKRAMDRTAAARPGKSPLSWALEINAPRPVAISGGLWSWIYSETMLAFQAPPAAVIQPVVRAGKMPGSQSVRHLCQPLRWVSCVQARRSCGMALAPEITLKRIYQIV